MSDGKGFLSYYARFARVLRRDAGAWARDNIAWAVVMLIAPPVAAYLQRGTEIDWKMIRTTLWIYGAVFCIYVFVHVLRTPWRLERERLLEAESAILHESSTAGEIALQERAARLAEFAEEAATFRNSAPTSTITDEKIIQDWEAEVQAWAEKVDAFLVSNCAPQASVRFKDFSNRLTVHYVNIHPAARGSYSGLERLIQNLHVILEKPGVYLKRISN
jgi:hypothetical protein